MNATTKTNPDEETIRRLQDMRRANEAIFACVQILSENRINQGSIPSGGFDDVIIGAPMADVDGKVEAGRSYVVFGNADGIDPTVDLATLDGTDGFRIDGFDAMDHFGRSLRGIGDVNNDGIDDFIIGADNEDLPSKSHHQNLH